MTSLYLPGWVLDGVGGGQVAPQTVSQQNHLLQAHRLSPLLYGVHKLLLCLGGIWRKRRPGAPPKSQQVKGVYRSRTAQCVHVPDPQAHPSSEAVDHHQGGLCSFGKHMKVFCHRSPDAYSVVRLELTDKTRKETPFTLFYRFAHHLVGDSQSPYPILTW